MNMRLLFLFLSLLIQVSCAGQSPQPASKKSKTMSAQEKSADGLEIATLGGGCFWCVEAVYQDVKGIHSVRSGYSGGSEETANYKAVSSGRTEHAEVIQIKFDPSLIGFEEILDIFWHTHDPTTLNRQGNDVGPHYRSVIFYHSETQKRIALDSKKNRAPELWDKPIVTAITAFDAFYEAEDYHQNYYKTVGDRNPYCTYVITPKMEKMKKVFKDKLKD
jgi:methionine-S-sulfoxide reductase